MEKDLEQSDNNSECLPMTKLEYFDDMFKLLSRSIFFSHIQEDGRLAIILESTILYPQGGGQPADTGFILSLDEKTKFRVEDVRSKSGVVFHYGQFESELCSFTKGQEVILSVDAERRNLNSRLHTAGHLLDVCMNIVGLTSLEPTKGHHFPDGPFVEYKGKIPLSDIETFRIVLEKESNHLISSGGKVVGTVLPYEEAASLCGGQLPQYIPKESKPRIVRLRDCQGCPCGGTHVADISDIKGMKVSQIRVKKGVTKVSYSIKQ